MECYGLYKVHVIQFTVQKKVSNTLISLKRRIDVPSCFAVYIHMYIVPSCFAVYIYMYIVPSCFAVYIHMYIVPSCCRLYSHVQCTVLFCRLYSQVHCATCSSCLIVGQYFKLVLEFLWKLVKNIFLKYNWFSRI